ncbi:MAG: GGDEF domain-containing protein [Candidatus Zixiibacteriota bacterium]
MDLALDTQLALIILLGILVVVLSFLLFTRIRAEKQRQSAIERMDVAQFIDFLRTNSVEGTIQVVAGKVSELLKSTFACERIVFLRKQRGFLELNYYHGIRRFNRIDFRMRFSPAIVERVRDSFAPRSVTSLSAELPDLLASRLKEYELDTFFPIFWRDNLYGVYFVKNSLGTITPTFALLVAGLAQSLSAAYHIKWHETRYEKLLQKMTDEVQRTAVPTADSKRMSTSILRLVRHRNSESLVPRLMESVQQELGLSRLVYCYEPKDDQSAVQLISSGLPAKMAAPERRWFSELLSRIGQEGVAEIDTLISDHESSPWPRQMREAGIKFLTRFPLSPRRSGLLALSGERPAAELGRLLAALQHPTQELYDNAEQFEQVEALSYTDNLTGLANQRYFCKRLSEEIDRARRYHRSLALIIFDMDDLKGINDRFGHQAGDTVLRRMGQILRTSIRAIDIIARYGGDEFCVIMPEADGATCERFMQRLQIKIAGSRFIVPEADLEMNFTISQGGATFPDHASDTEKLIFMADMALLRAKDMGRNACVLYSQALQTER